MNQIKPILMLQTVHVFIPFLYMLHVYYFYNSRIEILIIIYMNYEAFRTKAAVCTYDDLKTLLWKKRLYFNHHYRVAQGRNLFIILSDFCIT